MTESRPFLAAAAGAALLALFPVVVDNPYYIHLLETISIYAILLFGLDIVVGYTGQVSLGHAGLFGIGAYTAGVLAMHFPETPFPLVPVAAIAVTAAFGAVLALPALRVTGPYLAMVTLAFSTIVQILINEMTALTNGPMGITLPKPAVLGHELGGREFFWVTAGLLVAALLVVHRILRSHLGRAFEALRGSPVASDCMGVSVYRHKVIAFVISAGLAGLAGSLYSYSEQYISPNTYNFELTVMFLLAIIMGGRKTRSGALLGAAIIVMLPKLLDDVALLRWVSVASAALALAAAAISVARGRSTPRRAAAPVAATAALAAASFAPANITDWRLAIFGLITLFVVYYLQDGIVGFFRNAFGMKSNIQAPLPAGAVPASIDAVSQAAPGEGSMLQAQGV
ncbi:MAG: branched-chain amino acid ABC transporter permease, partial [Burkholderiaceae bacterium]